MEDPQPQISTTKKTKEPKKYVKSKLRLLLIVLSLCLIASGLYIVALVNAPKATSTVATAKSIPVKQNKVIIAKIGVDADILEGDNSVLDKGVWHRFPERGSPEMGGNFILTGHRFKFAPTPNLVKEASVFYNIDKLAEGDTILIHWNGKKYNYKITKRYKVSPSQTEIENVSESRLTLYTCTLAGSYDGREVIEARVQ